MPSEGASSPSGLAHVIVNAQKLPQLMDGDLTIKVVLEWQDALEDYFLIKDIPDEKKVLCATMTFRDVLMRDWIRADSARLRALSYKDFIAEFKQRWLPENWETTTRNELIRMRQSPTESFKVWLVKAATLNATLAGTPSHKKEDAFRAHVEGCLCERLSQLAMDAQTANITGYKAWQDALINHLLVQY